MTDSNFLLEICVDCLESIRNAIEGGANRLELCSALSEGGLTPSLGLVKLARRISTVPIFAMIRIRGGNFVYEADELEAMLEDLRILKNSGIDGFVFGALTSTNQVDVNACRKIIQAAHPLPVTFHRAFDQVNEPIASFHQIRGLGFSRILTSGQKDSAIQGIELIAKLVGSADNEIIVMPGAGINEKNISTVRDKSSAKEFHGSAKKIVVTEDGVKAAAGVTLTDVDTVRLMVKGLKETM